MSNKFRVTIIFMVFIIYAIFLAEPINLVAADLGRHLKNGEIILENFSVSSKNLYSYTYPDFKFLNHHWGFGVLFYLFYQMFGFWGISAIFVLVSLITVGLIFYLSTKYSNNLVVILVSVLTIPVITDRTEIRPEAFSYLFSAIFFYLLWQFRQNKFSKKWLLLLPLLMIFWINIHIYFVLGLFLIGIFAIESLFRRRLKDIRVFWGIGGLVVLSSLINPNFIQGVIYPFQIFGNYGYRVLENQSVFFLIKLIDYPPIYYFLTLFSVFVLSWIYAFINKRVSVVLLLLSLGISFLAFFAVRNLTFFGIFAIFVISYNFYDLTKKIKSLENIYVYLTVLVCLFFVILMIKPVMFASREYGLGLRDQNLQSLDFYKQNNLSGPIFNNYDIGGYLIFGLYPKERVFVDNRPEAYPAEFFKQVYIPMQEDDQKWLEQDQKYNFNTIFFYRRDLTPWAQKFLISRVKDTAWAPVFVDDAVIILVKRNDKTAEVINKFELPKEMFKIN